MNKTLDLKKQIEACLQSFQQNDLRQNAIQLFDALGYKSDKQIQLELNTSEGFKSFLRENGVRFADEKKAHLEEWKTVNFLFQLTDEEISQNNSFFDSSEVDVSETRIESYIFLTIELKKDFYRRSELAEITREINRIFPMPVMVLFKHGNTLTFSIIDRRLHKRNESKDVLQKVTLIKDIRVEKPHRAHLEILSDLSLNNLNVRNFVELHKEWQKVLDTKELNKKFFQELANWYFWAVENVTFPDDEEKDQEVRNATNVIRLITRLMFVWFLKEKGLVSDKLFDEKYLKTIIRFEDKSAFYKAILQNLFFATLNSEMNKREFIKETFQGKNPQHFVHNVFRYKSEFIKPEETIKELFEPIPFLNGGLFECLDKETEVDGTKCRVRVDGFSDNKKNVLEVPDELFFGREDEVDLNEIYGTKNKHYKVRGLINILNSYKFTIAENTPIEEEIALDPELLGKVFENLLASYNPETKTTARKQTGSFYTPREIVNYMVDESLIAYLKAKLQTETEGFSGYVAFGEDQPTMFGNEMRKQMAFEVPVSNNRWRGKDEDLETALRDLFSYTETTNKFNDLETEILLKGIDNCKILDPACGSGAFPMGILQRLVFLLKKLDPNNEKWREWQRQKAVKETEEAYKIGDYQEREDKLLEINDIFENNASDYGRKLFLIENSIYGVDIQPIAIQIAKLRFFISLIVDEKTNAEKENLGIRPLPNLETKFVAANTLIGLEAQGGLRPTKVNDLEIELKEVRAKHFSARTRKTKEKYREKDKEIRLEIADLLKQGGIKADIADQIAKWNPYDQNAKADWFDAEYMFGIEKGFDLVIGNPPYVKESTNKSAFEGVHTSPYYQGKMDLWYLFACYGLNFLKPKSGVLTFIATNNWVTNDGASKFRNKIVSDARLVSLIDFSNYKIFESADIQTMVMLFRRELESKEYSFDYRKLLKINSDINDVVNLLNKVKDSNYQYLHPIFNRAKLQGKTFDFSSDVENRVLDKIFEKGKFFIDGQNELMSGIDVLQDFVNKQSQKILSNKFRVGEGIFVITNEEKHQLNFSSSEQKLIKPYYTTKELQRYYGNNNNQYWIIYTNSSFKYESSIKPYPNIKNHLDKFIDVFTSDNKPYGLHRARDEYFFKGEKILSVRKCSIPTFTYVDFDCYVSRAFFTIKTNRINQKYLTGILNSKVVAFWLRKKGKMQGFQFQIDKTPLINIPIPKATDAHQAEIAEIVGEIIEAKKRNSTANTKELEKKIDCLVYQLYDLTDEEILIVDGKSK